MRRVTLPLSREALTFSVDVRRLAGEDPWRWEGVLRLAGRALDSGAKAGANASAWVACLPWTDRKHEKTEILTLSVVTDAALTRQQVGALSRPVLSARRGWSLDGVVTLPAEAFPVMVSLPEVHRTWRRDYDGTHRIAIPALGPPSRTERLTEDHGPDGPEEYGNVIAETGTDPGIRSDRERLKLAFATQVARSITQSDGVLDDREDAYMTENFGPDKLAVYGLDDDAKLAAAAAEADKRLNEMLGHHEKLALLSGFFAACWADGNVDVRELRALREASAVLGLHPQEVAGYLLKVK
ncbi:MAG: hypothetical protein KC912_03175 [Proteobacteria bacterium]|nr:hypothetical protein [Pseudomonadota bacterium]